MEIKDLSKTIKPKTDQLKAGFVSCEKKRQERIYSLNVENLEKFNKTLSEIVK